MANLAKLRFALITEDALEKLRPRSQSEFSKSNQTPEMYKTILSTVNQVLEQKLNSLNINKLIEDKIMEVQRRNGYIPSSQGSSEPAGYRTGSYQTEDGSTFTQLRESHSSHFPQTRAQRRTKKRRSNQPKVGELNDKTKFKLRKLLANKPTVVKPSSGRSRTLPMALAEPCYPPSRPTLSSKGTPFKATLPKSHPVGQPLITATQPAGVMGQQQQQPLQHTKRENDPDEPSILTLAAKYLQELDESRRKGRQSPDCH